jgi:hypothetical protein
MNLVYIFDGFDFVGSQPLGNWSKNENNVKKISLGTSHVNINNDSFRRYRENTGFGQDFYRYSTVLLYKKDFSFNL